MPDTAATIGYGTTLAIGDGATPTEVFTTVAEVTDLSPPSPSRDVVEATHYGSPGGYKEFISGLRDPGEASVQTNYTDAGYTALRTLFDSNVRRNLKISFPNGAKLTFLALSTSVEQTAPIAGVRQLTSKFKVSGTPTFVAGT